ncbi:hypothetical protein [Spirosoma flavum]|uniref:Uncharacterized protein n=1 Tax=Spirosoma flavum TaxID=2048557 RepID=A0ABW6AKQ0_9BACT
MNTLLKIGRIGEYRIYLNVPREAAVTRYIDSKALYPADFEKMLADGYVVVVELSVDDEFGAVDVFK